MTETNAARAAEILGGPDWWVDWTNDGRASKAEGQAEKQRIIDLITAALEEARRTALEECAQIADDAAAGDTELRDMARADKDGQGAFVHAAEVATSQIIAKRIRALLDPRPAAQPEGDR